MVGSFGGNTKITPIHLPRKRKERTMSLKSLWNTRKIKPGDDITDSQLKELFDAAKTERRIRSAVRAILAAIAWVCTVVAAVFSVLAYFKQ